MVDFAVLGNPDFIQFISSHKDSDTMALRMKRFRDLSFDLPFAIQQIECRRKAKYKIPELSELLLYPTGISIEQATSERLAKFHASLFDGCPAVVDLTCGLGIDTFYIAQKADQVFSVDRNQDVAATAAFNYNQTLKQNNIKVVCADSEEYVGQLEIHGAACFIDPSRRQEADPEQRIFSITDCSPDIRQIIPKIRDIASFLLVKASPMVDLTQTAREFPGISDIWVLALKNECKELLFKIQFTEPDLSPIRIHAINFQNDQEMQCFSCFASDSRPKVVFQDPEIKNFLCVPNAAIMKAGIYDAVCRQFELHKVSENSHLYLSDVFLPTFPGRQFVVQDIYTMSKRNLGELKKVGQANISCRNFPLTAESLRRTLKLKDGGETYLFATTTSEGKKIIMRCEKWHDSIV